MDNREIAIQITGLKKKYKLGQIGGGSLQADLQSWWARVRGKEDPNSKIGSDQRSNGKTFMALNGIDMTVYKGEALGIIGHNGAGKSTLLKLLSRVTAPTEGEICMNGRIASMLEVGTGFNGEMTGRENVYMNGAILGMTRAEVDAKMEQIIEFSEVREFIDTPVKRYSSGMYVKLAFSVAAHLDSEIMIMDEVLAVGDMAFQKKCLDKMREAAKQEGRTVLYVSHNMNTIRQLCDRCIVLDKGKVAFAGDVEDAIEIYMGKNEDVMNYQRDISQCTRVAGIKQKACINNIAFLNKTNCFFKHKEPIIFRIGFTGLDDLRTTKIRIIIRYQNDTPVGVAISDSTLDIVNGEKYSVDFKFNADVLADGRYYVGIGLYQFDDVGNRVVLDHVPRAIVFEKLSESEDTKEGNNLAWAHQWWGSTRFPDLQILE